MMKGTLNASADNPSAAQVGAQMGTAAIQDRHASCLGTKGDQPKSKNVFRYRAGR
jgi:hypothetical protein